MNDVLLSCTFFCSKKVYRSAFGIMSKVVGELSAYSVVVLYLLNSILAEMSVSLSWPRIISLMGRVTSVNSPAGVLR